MERPEEVAHHDRLVEKEVRTCGHGGLAGVTAADADRDDRGSGEPRVPAQARDEGGAVLRGEAVVDDDEVVEDVLELPARARGVLGVVEPDVTAALCEELADPVREHVADELVVLDEQDAVPARGNLRRSLAAADTGPLEQAFERRP